MTVVVGLEYDGGVLLGADSAGVAGWSITPRADEKVFVKRQHGLDWAFGFCGSFRLGQLVRYRLRIPKPPDVLLRNRSRSALIDSALCERWSEYMATKFVDALRNALKDGGLREERYEVQSQPGAFFVGVAGRLFCVEGDFQVGRSRFAFDAIGCGQDEARGALYALTDDSGPPENGVHAEGFAHVALRATDAMNGGVCAPYEYVVAEL